MKLSTRNQLSHEYHTDPQRRKAWPRGGWQSGAAISVVQISFPWRKADIGDEVLGPRPANTSNAAASTSSSETVFGRGILKLRRNSKGARDDACANTSHRRAAVSIVLESRSRSGTIH